MLMLIGVLWATFAPVLLLIPGCGLYLVTGKIPGVTTRMRRVLVAAAITLSVVLALWLPDSARFDAHCEAIGSARIFEKRTADGFFLDDGTANSFGMRYLQDEGFQWIEARSIYHRGGYTRYEKSGTEIGQKEVDRLTATIAVKSGTVSDSLSSTTFVTITDMRTNQVLARAANSHFNGGTARLVLGVWGTRNCPSPLTTAGSEEFNRFYHLARLTLR